MRKALSVMTILVCIFLFLAGPALSQQDYPTKQVSMILGFSPGGVADLSMRILGECLSKRFNQSFVNVPRPGAGQVIAVSELARSSPDGYTIGHFYQTVFTSAVYTHKVAFDVNDLKPVIGWLTTTGPLVIRSDAPYKNFEEFIAYAKKNTVTLGFNGTRGTGTSNRALWLLKEAGVTKIREVPYAGDSKQLPALLGGHIDVGATSWGGAVSYIDAGKLIALGHFYKNRLDSHPEIPTFEELGYKCPFPYAVLMCFAPKGTPDAIVKTLHDGIKSCTEDPWTKEKLAGLAGVPTYMDAEGMLESIDKEKKAFYPWLKELGVLKE